ncbi:hypothetical protein Syun_003851 [Stephania yunnanensis]|uniref:Uncharacterized protein n=1 Tax=Stephania yunnanensis TaxID=152371 RepID=A0AAP0L4U7_9MAGN
MPDSLPRNTHCAGCRITNSIFQPIASCHAALSTSSPLITRCRVSQDDHVTHCLIFFSRFGYRRYASGSMLAQTPNFSVDSSDFRPCHVMPGGGISFVQRVINTWFGQSEASTCR